MNFRVKSNLEWILDKPHQFRDKLLHWKDGFEKSGPITKDKPTKGYFVQEWRIAEDIVLVMAETLNAQN